MPHFHSTEPREIVNISRSRTDIHMRFFLKVPQHDFGKSQSISQIYHKYYDLGLSRRGGWDTYVPRWSE